MKTLLLLAMIGTVWMTVKKDRNSVSDVIRAIPIHPQQVKMLTNEWTATTGYQPYRCEEVSIDEQYPFRLISIYRPSQVNEYLTGVLEGKAQFIKDQAEQNKIDPLFFTAVIVHESANGKSRLARECNNISGIYKNGKYHTFDSVDECIEFTAKLMAGRIYRNCDTLLDIQRIYCPVGAANDPKGLNDNWASGVVHHMKQMANGETTYVKIEPTNNQI
jgi:beta-N-acetylglucosaminidase